MMGAVPGRPRLKARLARVLAVDGNPLRRASDRAEAWIRAGLLAVFLAAGPAAALAAGHWASSAAGAGAGAPPTAHLRAVEAVLLQPAMTGAGPAAAGRDGRVWVRARWEDADVSAATVEVPAPAGAPAGAVVTVWLDASGRIAGSPEPARSPGAAVLAAMVALAAVGLALLAVLRLTQLFLNWRRLAAWEAAWRSVGPRWTGHRS
jgi:hypothetical protein